MNIVVKICVIALISIAAMLLFAGLFFVVVCMAFYLALCFVSLPVIDKIRAKRIIIKKRGCIKKITKLELNLKDAQDIEEILKVISNKYIIHDTIRREC